MKQKYDDSGYDSDKSTEADSGDSEESAEDK